MDEMGRYRATIERRYRDRRSSTRRDKNGRRIDDRKDPPFWNIEIALQLIVLVLAGIVMLFIGE